MYPWLIQFLSYCSMWHRQVLYLWATHWFCLFTLCVHFFSIQRTKLQQYVDNHSSACVFINVLKLIWMCRCVSPWTRWLTVDSVLCRPRVLSPQCSSMAYISQHTAHWVGIWRGWAQTSTEALRTGSSAIFHQCFWWHCWFQLLNSNSKKKVSTLSHLNKNLE